MRVLIVFIIMGALGWGFEHRAKYKLHKDEPAWILIKRKSDSTWQRFDFSWTLYSDRINIILHTKYNDFVKQLTLSPTPKRWLFRQKLVLLPKRPYDDDLSVFLEFEDFVARGGIHTNQPPNAKPSADDTKDDKNAETINAIKPPYAVFNALIKDKNQILDIEFHPRHAVFEY